MLLFLSHVFFFHLFVCLLVESFDDFEGSGGDLSQMLYFDG